MKTEPIPHGMSVMSPSLVVKNATKAIEFYKDVFHAAEMNRLTTPDGKTVVHACLNIAGQTIFVADEMNGNKAPGRSGSYLSMYLYVGDVDKVHARAIEHGAKEVTAPEDAFWGERLSKFRDPYGVHWSLATRVENVDPEEASRRAEEFMKSIKKTAPKRKAKSKSKK